MSCLVPDCAGDYRPPWLARSLWAMSRTVMPRDGVCSGHRLAELEAAARADLIRGLELDELWPERVLEREAAENAKDVERLRALSQTRHTWAGDGTPYGVAALAGIVGDLSKLAPEEGSGRNHALNRAAYSAAGLVAAGVLEAGVGLGALRTAAERLRLPRFEASTTIRSGWQAGLKRPRLVGR